MVPDITPLQIMFYGNDYTFFPRIVTAAHGIGKAKDNTVNINTQNLICHLYEIVILMNQSQIRYQFLSYIYYNK
jgi:hypothetical protein